MLLVRLFQKKSVRLPPADGGLGAEKKQPKKQVIKLPWELITPFQDLLRNLPNWSTSKMQDEEDNDDEELEAYEDSIQRLRVCANTSLRDYLLIVL